MVLKSYSEDLGFVEDEVEDLKLLLVAAADVVDVVERSLAPVVEEVWATVVMLVLLAILIPLVLPEPGMLEAAELVEMMFVLRSFLLLLELPNPLPLFLYEEEEEEDAMDDKPPW